MNHWRAQSLLIIMIAALASIHLGFAEEVGGQSSKPLSVAPVDLALVTFPDDRPDWLGHSPDLSADVHRWPVVTTPLSTPQLSREALTAQLRAAAETYVETILGHPEAASLLSIEDTWIESHLSADRQYDGQVFSGQEIMYESAAELLFEPSDRQWIQSQWKSHEIGERLVKISVLAVLGGTLLFFTTAGMSVVARRAERRLTQSLGQ
jgi:hypothetical protein